MTEQTNYVPKSTCLQIQNSYRALHHSHAMLGDIHHFFYFVPSNFELHGILSSIDKDYVINQWKITSEGRIHDFCTSIWLSMRHHGLVHTKLRKKQIERAMQFYRY